MATTYVREDQAIISFAVTNPSALKVHIPSPYSWASFEGGDIEAEDVFTRPGGMKPGLNLGGPSKRSDVTIKTQYTSDWTGDVIVALENACGALAVSASWTRLDATGNKNGQSFNVTGILKSVQKPVFDANASGAVFIGLVIACDTEASTSGN